MSDGTVGLLGVGAWGRHHLRVLSALGVLRSAFDPDPARLVSVPAALRAASMRAVLEDPAIRAVVIATPAQTHAGLAQLAIESGKDVFIEKPLALTAEDGRLVARLAAERGQIAMVGHITLYHPGIECLRELLQRGELGTPRYIYSNRLNRGTWRTEEDILWSFAPHDFATFLHLLDRWPVEVIAHGGNWLPGGRADLTVTHLDFGRGLKGHVFVSWLHPLKEHRLVVLGDRRMAVFVDGKDGGRLSLHDPVDPPPPGTPAAPSEERSVPFTWREPLENELRHFLQCVRDREEPRTSARNGLLVLDLLEAARASLVSGRPVRPERSAEADR